MQGRRRRSMLAAMSSVLEPPVIRDFAGEAVYAARRDRPPVLIARCAGRHDVAAALRAARERGLAVSVRGGGHATGAEDAMALGNRSAPWHWHAVTSSFEPALLGGPAYPNFGGDPAPGVHAVRAEWDPDGVL